jgi:V-type H+-transporting ATPase subunit a
MGFFATYCGFIYNDFMSISLNIFISCYDINTAVPGLPIRRLSPDCVYPLGIDPIWSVSDDQMNYVNSLKMKIAVIIGVIHMTLGIFLKASNSIYFRKWLDVFF